MRSLQGRRRASRPVSPNRPCQKAANSSLQPACNCIGKRFKMSLQRDVSPGTAFEKRGTGVYAEGIRQQNTYLSPMYHISVSFTVDPHADNVSYAGPAAEPVQFLLPSAPINMEAMSVAGVYSSRAISMINSDIYSILATRMPTAWIRPIFPGISSSLLRSRLYSTYLISFWVFARKSNSITLRRDLFTLSKLR